MTAQNEPLEAYRLSSQQCGVHVPQWQTEPPVVAIVVEGPAGADKLQALRRSLDRLVERHEILRTHYRLVPGLHYPLQHVAPKLAPGWVALERVVDDDALLRAARSLVDPRQGPVLACATAPTPQGKLRWALAAPACALDLISLQELAAACLQEEPGDVAEQEALQYADYAAWQAELFAGELGQEGARFWQAQAVRWADAPRLPFEAAGTAGRGPSETIVLSDAAVERITALAASMGLPAERVLAALWSGYMARLAQADGLGFEWHCDARADELAGALGCFTSRLPVSLALDPSLTARALVRSVADVLDRATSWHECFDAAAFLEGLTLEGKARPGLEFAHVRVLPLPGEWEVRRIDAAPGPARLRCDCIEADGRWTLRWSATDAQTPQTLGIWMRQFEVLLKGLDRQPELPWSERPLMGEAERAHLLGLAGRRCEGRRTDTLHQLFEEQARRTPHALAVVCGEERLTYEELDAQADRLAHRLRAGGARSEQVIGVRLGRSVQAIVAMLAVMKSGAAYAPLDPGYPPERIALMVEDAGISTLVVHSQNQWTESSLDLVCFDHEVVDAKRPCEAPFAASGNLAYLIYTSGSTGRPKGVMVSHANAVASTVARFSFYSERVSRFLLLSSFSFDSSVAGIFWTLGQGGELHLPTEDAHRDPERIARLIAAHRISHVLTLPSFYKQILDRLAGDDGHGLRCAVVAGEACHADVVQRHRQRVPQAALVNEYGPTEGTVWSNAFHVEPPSPARGQACADVPVAGQRIPIGRAIPSMRSYVLDAQMELCAIGMPGELYIGGDGITRGYHARPGLTAQRFVADPHASGQRLYRTGDAARYRPDGEVEYLGRLDNQVKLRGHRIELGEIEALLLAQPHVREAAVLVRDDVELGQRLLAYVVAEAGVDAEAVLEALESRLGETLPAFMVPSRFVLVPHLPAMPNGKVDRQALLALGDAVQRPPFVAPRSEVERTLAEIWESVLKVDRVGLEDRFFRLGGHSLLVAQVTARIRQRLSVDLPLRELFEAPTLKDLAARVEAARDAGQAEAALMDELLADAEGLR